MIDLTKYPTSLKRLNQVLQAEANAQCELVRSPAGYYYWVPFPWAKGTDAKALDFQAAYLFNCRQMSFQGWIDFLDMARKEVA